MDCLTTVNGIFYQCPSKCTCNNTIIKCNDRQLKTIPDFDRLNFNPNTINLIGNKIEEVLSYHFYHDRLETLKYLQLNDNDIFDIQKSSFEKLQALEYLDISNNQLDELPSEIIQRNTKLLELNLSNNLFGVNTPIIVSQSLLVLDLSSCKLTSFTEDNLEGVPYLKSLYLHVNNFQHLDYRVFRKSNLQYLDISYNPWKCHCETVKLFEHLINYEIVTLTSTVQCLHPNKLFEDIYDKGGAVSTKFCHKRSAHSDNYNLHKTTNVQKPEQAKEREKIKTTHVVENSKENILGFIMHFEVLIVIGVVSVLIVVSLITLAVVYKQISYKNSPFMVDFEDVKVKYEVSQNPEEWKYVERTLPAPTVPTPIPKDKYPSEWKPQGKNLINKPYFISRTKNHMLPVYLCISQRGMRRITKIRNIQGDIWLLEQQLRKFLEPQNDRPIRSQVNEFVRHIRFHGDHVNAIKYWLMERNF
ncbi:hypothetical protein FQA39_LY04445 [Lamprigera yunnana]|nr:hypothetical protein FQA39_LY04445 [Lamprigera yunnana]